MRNGKSKNKYPEFNSYITDNSVKIKKDKASGHALMTILDFIDQNDLTEEEKSIIYG